MWHPYSQVGADPESIGIERGEGSLLYDYQGGRYVDAISSWWVTLHGHAHPRIADAIASQARQLEQVIFSGFTHEPAVGLAERLLPLLPGNLGKVFLSDNGSTAVEVALKIAIQYFYNKKIERRRIIAFEGGYHGDTFGSMSVSRGTFTAPFDPLLFEVTRIPVPVAGKEKAALSALKSAVASQEIAAFIFEPLILGAGGMVMYSPEILSELADIVRSSGGLIIADEVMTGFGRTGPLFASSKLTTAPDIMTLSKGITGGFLPLGATAVTNELYEAFRDSDRSRMLLHGHSYAGNPIACAAAGASLDLLLETECGKKRAEIEDWNSETRNQLCSFKSVHAPRVQGTIFAFELGDGAEYFSSLRNMIIRLAHESGVILRPLGNTIYCMPPYSITSTEYGEIRCALKSIVLNFERGVRE